MATYVTEPEAKILADSISPDGHRLTTMQVTMHRFVLAEFNTHRVFSRNSASSRAIPYSVQRQRVLDTPAMPVVWPSKQRGMQGGATVPPPSQAAADKFWRDAAKAAVVQADLLNSVGVHKSVANRLLEPFLYQTVIVTSTEWAGFFAQRDSELAQPEIAVAAKLMREAYDTNVPLLLNDHEWHTPLIQPDETDEFWQSTAMDLAGVEETYPEDALLMGTELRTKVSAARCARVSYLTHDGKRDIQADLDLYERLVNANPPHWSPLEHVATPCQCGYYAAYNGGGYGSEDGKHLGNFHGWDQLRHIVEDKQ